jgi:hypothetical protein
VPALLDYSLKSLRKEDGGKEDEINLLFPHFLFLFFCDILLDPRLNMEKTQCQCLLCSPAWRKRNFSAFYVAQAFTPVDSDRPQILPFLSALSRAFREAAPKRPSGRGLEMAFGPRLSRHSAATTRAEFAADSRFAGRGDLLRQSTKSIGKASGTPG